MTKRSRRSRPAARPVPARQAEQFTQPIDVVDGIPDRAARRPAWRLIVIVVLCLLWVGFLVYCAFAGSLGR